jgi:hypothetical protein
MSIQNLNVFGKYLQIRVARVVVIMNTFLSGLRVKRYELWARSIPSNVCFFVYFHFPQEMHVTCTDTIIACKACERVYDYGRHLNFEYMAVRPLAWYYD